MTNKHDTIATTFATLALACCLVGCHFSKNKNEHHEEEEDERLEIAAAFEFWNMARMYPDGKLHSDKLEQALNEWKGTAQDRGPAVAWEAIGPKNIGGRTLCLAIHPQDTNVLFMGSASGGLWKSTTQGKGVEAWERIETGFPVIGVGAIAIDPQNPNNMYIGTGEVYNYENSAPNVVVRTTRGTYGIGILKTTDGGATWQKSWDVDYNDLTGVQQIMINPLRPQTIFATTTKGILRSYDSGATWSLLFERPMAVDLDFAPNDTSRIFATFGSLDDQAASGIFRSTDGGDNFSQLTSGLPATYGGKAMLDISKSNPNIIFASVGDAFVQKGLYRSADGGETWAVASTQDVARFQGWYSHDVAIDPADPNRIMWCGVDIYTSFDAGTNVLQVGYWYNWDFGFVPIGGPEGPPDYVHADMHHLYYHPTNPNTVFVVTDGGLFISYDGGIKWEGRNGSYQTQQFYANFSNSVSNPDRAMGGMQDNGSAIYFGDGTWKRVIGGDGGSTAINPFDDAIIYGSSQNGNFYTSVDDFDNYAGLGAMPGNTSAFIAPFELAPTNSEIVYSGKNSLCRYDFTQGSGWEELTSAGGVLVTIAVNPNDENDLYFSRAASTQEQPKVFRFNVTTQSATLMTGLPNRTCLDIAYHPTDANTTYAVFGGFGTAHLYRTTNGGTTWQIVPGIPDVPTNSVLVDPLQPSHLYVGNDLGVWFSPDAGTTWQQFSADGPQAMLAIHLSISADRKLRVATHGLGVWQAPMVHVSSTRDVANLNHLLRISPNPASDFVRVQWSGDQLEDVRCTVLDAQGRTVAQANMAVLGQGTAPTIPVGHLPSGRYVLSVEKGAMKASKVLVVR
jgi:photosystem II stability/assembly factor-like uncharacterized protein